MQTNDSKKDAPKDAPLFPHGWLLRSLPSFPCSRRLLPSFVPPPTLFTSHALVRTLVPHPHLRLLLSSGFAHLFKVVALTAEHYEANEPLDWLLARLARANRVLTLANFCTLAALHTHVPTARSQNVHPPPLNSLPHFFLSPPPPSPFFIMRRTGCVVSGSCK